MSNQLRWLVLGAAFGVSLPFVERVSTSPAGQAGTSAPASGAAMSCDMQQYKAATGLTAAMQGGVLTVQWAGGDGAECARAMRSPTGRQSCANLRSVSRVASWATLGQDLKPEYRVVSGIRRFSSQQGEPLQGLGQLTPERAEKEKWYAYRDAPLYMGPPSGPGGPGVPGHPVRVAAAGGGGGGGDDEDRPAGAGPRRTRCRACGTAVSLHVAKAGRHSPRELVIQDDLLQREDGRRAHRGHVQWPLDGHFLRKSPVHGLPWHQPNSHGRGGVDQRTVGRL